MSHIFAENCRLEEEWRSLKGKIAEMPKIRREKKAEYVFATVQRAADQCREGVGKCM